ncbi:MAG: hypothetical protein ACK417_02345 [Bacteroidia bacterium]
MKNRCFTAIMLLFVTLVACTKEDIPGPQGPPGVDGNANVKSQRFINRPFFLNPLANIYEVFLDWDGLSPDIVANGSVQVFIAPANDGGSSWTALPGRFSPDLTTWPAAEFDVQVSAGRVVVYTAAQPVFNVDFRVVAIAGN